MIKFFYILDRKKEREKDRERGCIVYNIVFDYFNYIDKDRRL